MAKFALPDYQNLTWHSCNKNTTHWILKLGELGIVDDKTGFSIGHNASVVIDSGTSFLIMDTHSRAQLLKILSDKYSIKCGIAAA